LVWLDINFAGAGLYESREPEAHGAASAGKLITGTGIGSPINPVSQNDEQPVENTNG
jgi:hypothetical protein